MASASPTPRPPQDADSSHEDGALR
jgi:hypothetical protein